MSNQLWTKENSTYENWVLEIRRFFFTKEWLVLESPLKLFYPLYERGFTVAEAILEGHKISDEILHNQAISKQESGNYTEVPEQEKCNINASLLNTNEQKNPNITLHRIVRTGHLWEATVNETGKTHYFWEHEFKIV
jgi:hypothetical protein